MGPQTAKTSKVRISGTSRVEEEKDGDQRDRRSTQTRTAMSRCVRMDVQQTRSVCLRMHVAALRVGPDSTARFHCARTNVEAAKCAVHQTLVHACPDGRISSSHSNSSKQEAEAFQWEVKACRSEAKAEESQWEVEECRSDRTNAKTTTRKMMGNAASQCVLKDVQQEKCVQHQGNVLLQVRSRWHNLNSKSRLLEEEGHRTESRV